MEHLHPVDSGRRDDTLRGVARPATEDRLADATPDWLAFLRYTSNGRRGRMLYVLVFKRTLDLMIASAMLVVLSPVLLAVVVAIALDSSGPVLYRQIRIGRGHRPFTIYKFRTMAHDPSGVLVLMRDEDGTLRHKIRHDPRVTRVGGWLRKTSIDELPQLFNVIRGEMSLVGPRPELPQIVATYQSWQHQRHLVRPGLTGWWQVNGRSDQPMHEHTELDLYYVEHLSFWLDVRIAFRTVRVVLNGLGAF